MSDRTDSQLISEYLDSGNEAAFGSLAERHAPMVYRVCLRILGERSAAEDAAQATFVVLLRKAASLSGGGDLSAWLHGVARNVALQARRSRYRRAKAEEAAAVNRQNRDDRAETGEGRELLSELDREIAGLPPRQRQAVVLR